MILAQFVNNCLKHITKPVIAGTCNEQRTTKLVPKLVRVASAIAGPLTARGNTSPTMIQEIGPKLICSHNDHPSAGIKGIKHGQTCPSSTCTSGLQGLGAPTWYEPTKKNRPTMLR